MADNVVQMASVCFNLDIYVLTHSDLFHTRIADQPHPGDEPPTAVYNAQCKSERHFHALCPYDADAEQAAQEMEQQLAAQCRRAAEAARRAALPEEEAAAAGAAITAARARASARALTLVCTTQPMSDVGSLPGAAMLAIGPRTKLCNTFF
jgi:hypothetical protein